MRHPARPFSGSSPLTRGKLTDGGTDLHQVQLIPAHAGKTQPYRPCPCPSRAHPRSRGENLSARDAAKQKLGSSPLTRGKLVACRTAPRCSRLIPAHAGKTDTNTNATSTPAAHPRSRGENRPKTAVFPALCGSFPLTRGKPWKISETGENTRLIPAHAGKTWRTARRASHTPAHPRSRGENPCSRAHSASQPAHPRSRGENR